MGGVLTLAATVAAAAGAVAAYRFIDRRKREFSDILRAARGEATGERERRTLDYERDPVTGVYRPRD